MSERVRGKFTVTRYLGRIGGKDQYEKVEMRTVVLHPVYSDDPQSENKRFWDASPSGEIRLGTVNPEAWKQFELDGEYFVDFTKVA